MGEADNGSASPSSETLYGIARMVIATVLLGVGTGIIGIGVAILIKIVQAIGFGHVGGGFLLIAEEAPAWRRFASVTVAGFFSAGAWYWLRGREPGFVPVEECMQGEKMPPGVTLMNGAIQDIAVALGGSFGREAAPREIAAMWGSVIADSMELSATQRRTLVACGAGAGLAAVYSVPISGALYTIEHILNWDLSLGALIPAIVASCLATLVSSPVVETDGLYHMPRYSKEWPSAAILIWALVIGPICGIAAALFLKVIKFARGFRPNGRLGATFEEVTLGQSAVVKWPDRRIRIATVVSKTGDRVFFRLDDDQSELSLSAQEWNSMEPHGARNWHILIGMPAAFLLLAVLSVRCPSLLGNGRALAEVAIHRLQHGRSVATLLLMLICKVLVTAAAIASGVDGGTLTPSVAIGATLGAVIGQGWQETWPIGPPREDEKAILASAAFLAPAMRSPVTALWLIVEFTAQGVFRGELLALARGDPSLIIQSKFGIGMLLPLATAVSAAMLVFDFLSRELPAQESAPEDPAPEKFLARRNHSDASISKFRCSSDLDLGVEVVHMRQTLSLARQNSDADESVLVELARYPSDKAEIRSLKDNSSRLSDLEEGSPMPVSTPTASVASGATELQHRGTQTQPRDCSGVCLEGVLRMLAGRRNRSLTFTG